MNEHAIAQMPSHAPRKRQPLAIAPDAHQIGRRVKVIYPDHLLIYDGSCIQLRGCVMACRPNQLDAPIVRTLVWIRPDE